MTRKRSRYARQHGNKPRLAHNAHETAMRGVLLLSPADREAFYRPAADAAERLISSTGTID